MCGSNMGFFPVQMRSDSDIYVSDSDSEPLKKQTLPKSDYILLLIDDCKVYQYPVGVAENMLVQVGKFIFPWIL